MYIYVCLAHRGSQTLTSTTETLETKKKSHASNGVEDLIHGGTVTAVTKHELEHMPYAD